MSVGISYKPYKQLCLATNGKHRRYDDDVEIMKSYHKFVERESDI